MLVRNLTLSGTRSEHTVRVSTIYQFVTVFNHSDHAIIVFPENLTNEREKHYRVPPRIYLTLPLFGAGTVESCQREVVYTIVSEGSSIPASVITLSFTEVNNNVNMPFPDLSVPAPFPPTRFFGGVLTNAVLLLATRNITINAIYLNNTLATAGTVTLTHRRPGVADVNLVTGLAIAGNVTYALGFIALAAEDSLVASGVTGTIHCSVYGGA